MIRGKHIFAAAICVLLAGCNGYLRDRTADLADIGRLNVGGGYGVSADGSLTRYVRFSVGGYENAHKVGFVGRRGGLWKERRLGLACIGGWAHTSREPIVGNAYYPERDPSREPQLWYEDHARGATEIVFSGFLLVGFEAGVDPGQMLDFILGFAGIDIYNDDHAGELILDDQPDVDYFETREQPHSYRETPQ